MSQRDPIRVFVTHAWEHGDDYLRVFEYLESARNFYYRNCSNPDQHPVDKSVEGLREELRRQIAPSEVVVALSSLYGTHRDLLQFQLHYAKASDKPVVLMPGFGRELPLPRELASLADMRGSWEERGMVDAIRQQARHEDTTRWDTIEFKIE
ncbi:MAG: hypothetical protein KGL25_05960 [Gammaproteobacteria bacterium]|nr:hypothetical protein [Gammaproteobacteria bacterium]